MTQETRIRWMIRMDMPTVYEIEEKSFEFAWSKKRFAQALRQLNCIGIVAERNEVVVGFMLYDLHKSRLHVRNLAVDPNHRRTGVGSEMIDNLKRKLSYHRRNRIVTEVRETNLTAQLHLRSLGFRAVSVLRDFYQEVDESAYVMQYRYKPTLDDLYSEVYADASMGKMSL